MAYQVIVEYRPKIRACQFFVKAKLNQDSIEIILKDNIALILTGHNTTEIAFPKSVQHIVNSVSGLNFMEDSICFRTRTNPDKMFGTFERELILSNEEESIHNFVPKVHVGKTVTIFCRHCLSALTNEVCFERRLPLPLFSSAEDYFCHHKPSTEDILNPRLKDCLYGLYFYKVNPAIFECDILEGNVFVCPNCSSWLGISALGFVQLWNSTTILNDTSPMASGDNVALQDFLNLIEVATSEKHAGCKTNKLILYCTGVADCSTDQYLLIWIMEKKLNIFTSKNPVPDQVKLKHDKVCKVLYLFENHKSEKVNEWLNFNEANCVPISKNMFVEGHEHLKRMSFNIPTKFRSANNMYVSYIGNLK